MCVSRNNNRWFLAIVLGIFLASGCSGHAVKYGAHSEGEGVASSSGDLGGPDGHNGPNGLVRNADGTTVYGGSVNGNRPNSLVNEGNDKQMAGADNSSSVVGSGSDYGRQFEGVDGTGPNHGAVTGFGSGSANAKNPGPEDWANRYLRAKRNNQDVNNGPSTKGSSRNSASNGVNEKNADYGRGYAGVPGSGPNHGGVTGFSQGSASPSHSTPEQWAQAYLKENGGPAPEYVDPDMDIVQVDGKADPRAKVASGSNEKFRKTSTTSRGSEGRVQDIYFDFDSWSISSEGAKYLEEDAKWLHANPGKALTIEGHCDQRGTQDYNLILGKKRAEAAREYLVNLGIQPHRLKIVSYGKERPFCQNHNENCFQENRRNHMVVRINQS